MAIFRKIHVTFWSDSFISSLDDKTKLFYLYLLTNERTTQLGVYEITKKQIAFDLGYSIDTVSKLIDTVQKSGKIRYNTVTCEMAVKNWNKYNGNESKKVKVLTDKESSNIKDKSLIEYLYSINTVSILNPPQEEEEEEEPTKEPAQKEPPPLVEFLEYAKENYTGNFLDIKSQVELKYKAWVANGWKTGKDKPIKNWKSTLLNTMPFFTPNKNGTNNATQKPINTPALLDRDRRNDES